MAWRLQKNKEGRKKQSLENEVRNIIILSGVNKVIAGLSWNEVIGII